MRKHSSRRPLLFGVAFAILVSSVSSNIAAAASLADVLAAVDSNSVEILAAKSGVARARSAHSTARAIPNPALFGSSEKLESDRESVRENTIGVRQELGFLWSRAALRSHTKAELRAAESSLQLATIETYSRTLNDLMRLQHVAAELSLLDNVQTHLDDIIRANEARVEQGDISGFDAQRVRFEAISVNNRRAGLVAEYRAFADSLGRATMLSESELLTVNVTETLPINFKVAAEALDYARANSVALATVSAQADAALKRVKAAKSNRLPGLTIAAGQKTATGDASGLLLEAELELPLFNRRGADVQLAKAEARNNERVSHVQSSQLETEVKRAFAVWRQLGDASSDSLSQDLLLEHLDTAHELYSRGETGYIELIDAFTAATTALREYFEIGAARLAADLHLRQLTGYPILEN